MPRSVLRRRSHNPSRPDSPTAAPREQNAFCSSPKGCRKAEKCGDSRSRTFRPGGNAGVRRKGQRVSESSSERTHNARRYATLPGPEQASLRARRRIPARPRAAWRCVVSTTHHLRCIHSRKARSGTHKAKGLQGEVDGDAVGGNGRLALMARSVEVSDQRERTPPRRRWRKMCASRFCVQGRRVEPERLARKLPRNFRDIPPSESKQGLPALRHKSHRLRHQRLHYS